MKSEDEIVKKDLELIERLLKDPDFDQSTRKGLEEYKKELESKGMVINE